MREEDLPAWAIGIGAEVRDRTDQMPINETISLTLPSCCALSQTENLVIGVGPRNSLRQLRALGHPDETDEARRRRVRAIADQGNRNELEAAKHEQGKFAPV